MAGDRSGQGLQHLSGDVACKHCPRRAGRPVRFTTQGSRMISTKQVQDIVGAGGHVLGQDGSKIGSVGQVYLDDETSRPEWVTTRTGMFGTAESFVPLARARKSGPNLLVPFDKETVKGAPRVADSNGHLTQDEEAELYSYYGR